MGHLINSVIGRPDAVGRVIESAGCPVATPLHQGFAIAPLGEKQIDALTGLCPGLYLNGFNDLSEGLLRGILAAVGGDAVAYVETEYFGGTGSQAAAVLDGGKIAYQAGHDSCAGPASPNDPINAALRQLGVNAVGRFDEFAALNLQKFRSLETLGITCDDDGDDDQ